MKTWAIPAALIVALQYVVALGLGAWVGFPYRIAFLEYVVIGLIASALGVFLVIATRLIRHDFGKPLPLSIVAACMLVALQWAVIMWLKVMLPVSVGFWADPLLANADGVFGEPWRYARAALPWAGNLIDRAYLAWAPLKFGLLFLICLAPESRRKTVAIVAYFLTGCVCTLLQFALPSAGPVFYEALGHGSRFRDLPVAHWVRITTHYLWIDYQHGTGRPGAGISAFPSVHVATALWMALAFRSYVPRLQPVGWAFFGLVLVGSVYLGWHYALDGIASVLIGTLAWRAARGLSNVQSRTVFLADHPVRRFAGDRSTRPIDGEAVT